MCIFSQDGCIFCHEVFFIMYLPLAFEINKELFKDCFGFMAVNEIKKHPLGLNQSKYAQLSPCFCFNHSSLGGMRAALNKFDFVQPSRCSLSS